MTIFSEIYGAYYRTAARILEHEKISSEEINRTISDEAFRDSLLFLQPALIPQKDGSDWHLLCKNKDGSLSRRTSMPPPKIITAIQKSWLRAKLADPKFRLFLDDDNLLSLKNRLDNVKPLYNSGHFYYPDIFSDGDDYSSDDYRRIFRSILSAQKRREILEISYFSGRGKEFKGFVLPVKIIYSKKNDKFRLYAVVWKRMPYSRDRCSYVIMNIGRISDIKLTGKIFDEKISEQKILKSFRCSEPVRVFVSTERNAVERFMMEFSAYEKHTVRDVRSGCCTVELWYDKQDETELLIRLLSFGPTIKILGPPFFKQEIKRRVKRQYELLFGENNTSAKDNSPVHE